MPFALLVILADIVREAEDGLEDAVYAPLLFRMNAFREIQKFCE